MAVVGGPNLVADGLVLYLDAANAESYPGSGSTWYDLSGNSRNFSTYNSPTYNSAGYWALGGTNQYFEYPNLPVQWGNSDYTIDTVFRLSTAVSGVFGLVSTMTGPFNLNTLGMEIRVRTFGIEFTVNDGSGSGVRTTSVLTWQTNIWYHIAFAYTKSSSCVCYINGSNNVTQSYAGEANYNNIYNLSLGRANDGYLNGDIASVKIYNRVLSAAEILQNYSATRSRFGL
jgi:hypothetical protein